MRPEYKHFLPNIRPNTRNRKRSLSYWILILFYLTVKLYINLGSEAPPSLLHKPRVFQKIRSNPPPPHSLLQSWIPVCIPMTPTSSPETNNVQPNRESLIYIAHRDIDRTHIHQCRHPLALPLTLSKYKYTHRYTQIHISITLHPLHLLFIESSSSFLR